MTTGGGVTGADSVKAWIDSQDRFRGSEWVMRLDDRKREEAEFHDADRADHQDEVAGEAVSPNRRFYSANEPVSAFLRNWMRERVPGTVFLDYACGGGWQTIAAAKAGAALAIGIDISETSVRNATENAEAEGVSGRTRFLQRDCEATEFPAESIDVCLCSGMLHHLDLERAFPELARILAPGGEVLGVEALKYNPAINLYRRMTPALRTEWETKHILGLGELRLARRWFDVRDVKYHILLAPLAGFLPPGPLRRGGLFVTHLLDSILTKIPGIQLLSWQFTFRLVKRGR